ncbi:proto-oncogene Mas-like [Ambystoma mexicanum]|uniref:proto-oncogene Mas-like n=1 Tax=Ambystoma mexicanum TaxID=8296 RepID=UPI0037E974DD
MEARPPPHFNGSGEAWPPENGMNGPTPEDCTILLVLRAIALVFSLLGLVGNGTVLWFLCFRIPRNQFTVYILNLALADFTVLLCSFPTLLFVFGHPMKLDAAPFAMKVLLMLRIIHLFGYNTSLYLLTAISVERCLSVFQPIWYKCRRPQHQSVIVCVLLWGASCLLTGPEFFICDKEMYKSENKKCSAALIASFGFGFVIFAPLMVICSLSLLCKIRHSSQQRQPLKVYVVIAIAVLVFLMSTVPPRLLDLLLYFKLLPPGEISFFSAHHASMLCSSINSSGNPFIYVFVGGLWRKRGQGPIHGALQSVFKSEMQLTEHEEEAGI